jgi:hypothetical protein
MDMEDADPEVMARCALLVDLMNSACGLDYAEVSGDIVRRNLEGVSIPFASPKMLWRMKQTYREKDAVDRVFLRQLLGDSVSEEKL